MNESLFHSKTIFRLTVLWAFVEGGLGGVMHLFHIPFTGFIVGGFSIIINILVAKYSQSRPSVIFQVLVLVLISKFSLSPHSPPGAYIAVCFQSIMSIIIFNLFRFNSIAISIYSILCMLENAIQKPLMAYIIFGDELLKGIILSVNNFFHNLSFTENLLWGSLTMYFIIYALWGGLIAKWTILFVKNIDNYHPHINLQQSISVERELYREKKMNIKFLTIVSFSLIIFSLMFYFTEYDRNWGIYLVKIIVWIFFLSFILPVIVKKILARLKSSRTEDLNKILIQIPEIKNTVLYCYHESKKHNGLTRWKEFIFLVIYFNVFYEEGYKNHIT